jgi:predicted transposase/invertase (TIGR01784 family)
VKTDHVFYRLFKDYPETLFDLLGEDPSTAYEMSAVQVKELQFTFDGVLVPENGEGTIYFLEVQFYDDAAFYPRLFGQVFLHQSDHYRGAKKSDAGALQDVRIVVIYPEYRANEELLWTTLHRDALAWPSIQRIYIDELPQTDNLYTEVVRLVIASPEEIPQAVQRLSGLAEIEGPMLDILQDIIVKKLPLLSPEEVKKMLGFMDTKLEDTRYYKDIAAKTEKRVTAENTVKMGLKMLKTGMSLEQVTAITELPAETLQAALQAEQQQEAKD